MTAQAIPSRRGLALTLMLSLILSLLTVPVWAAKDMQIATNGDPGDGNLGPSAVESSSGSAGGIGAGSLSTEQEFATPTPAMRIMPAPGLFVVTFDQAVWFVRHIDGLSFITRLQEGRSGHAR